MMRRADVLERLRAELPGLRRRFGVRSLALFGSYARDEARSDSDVDLLVDFDRVPSWAELNTLIDLLESALGSRVDLVSPSKLKPRMRPNVERDLISVA
jgi:predicted nucleotidyltransferase